MTTTDTDRLDRLPQWARRRIEVAEADLARLREDRARGIEDTDTIASPFVSPVALRRGERVRFLVGGARIDVWASDGALRVNAEESVHVIPQASNALAIVPGEYR